MSNIDRETQRKLDKLEALEAGGVDNWDFYDASLEDWRKENHIDECIDDAVAAINDLLAEEDISEPAGTGAGWCVDFDVNGMHRILHKLIRESGEHE